MTGTIDTDQFWTHGYQICRSIYTPEQVDRFREGALATASSAADLLANPSLRGVLLHPPMVEIARAILGTKPVYFGDSGCQINGLSGFHKDNPDRHNPNGPDWTTPGHYRLIRFGLYLQDHSEHSGSVGFRDGSHVEPDRRVGKSIYAAAGIGDLVVWTLRTTHRGQVHLLRGSRHPLPTKLEPWIPSIAKIPQPSGDRIGLFWTFGIRDRHLDRYCASLMTRRYAIERWEQTIYDDECRRQVEVAGIELLDLRSEILTRDNSGATEKHTTLRD